FNAERMHLYFVRVLALDVASLDLPKRFTADDAYRARHGHVLAEAALHGTDPLNPARG
ncbi:YbhB/YbcL family Raf kinase inhibitor-like protein, partial [Stenotrophomonas maltophilia]